MKTFAITLAFVASLASATDSYKPEPAAAPQEYEGEVDAAEAGEEEYKTEEDSYAPEEESYEAPEEEYEAPEENYEAEEAPEESYEEPEEESYTAEEGEDEAPAPEEGPYEEGEVEVPTEEGYDPVETEEYEGDVAPVAPETEEYVPSATEPEESPAEVYEEPAQEKCGSLYGHVLEEWFRSFLSEIDPAHLEEILSKVKALVEMFKGEIEIPALVSHVTDIGGYIEENVTEVDEDLYGKIDDVIATAKTIYERLYESPVNEKVAKAFDGLFESCKGTGEEESKKDYVQEFHDAYTSYLTEGKDGELYQGAMEDLKKADDEAVAEAAEEVEGSVKTLSDSAGDAVDIESSAAHLTAGGLAVAVAAFVF